MATLNLLLCIIVVTFGISNAVPAHEVPPTSVPPSECRSMMDLVLVVDGSDSILSEDYDKQRHALTSLMKQLGLGPLQVQVGIVVYSTTIAQIVNITYDRAELIEMTSNLTHPADGTMTSLGIKTARDLFKSAGRTNVPWVCIVITDGKSKFPRRTANEARITKELGVNMFAVGISSYIKASELEAIASDPTQVLKLHSFDQLTIALSGLMKVVCPCPPPPPVPFGIYDEGPRAIGHIRQYTCEPGYQPMGNDKIECLKNSQWSPLEFSCLECPPPPVEHGNGVVVTGGNTLDTVREYVCQHGYASPHPITSQCVPGPNGPYWTKPELTCLNCPPLDGLIDGYNDPLSAEPTIGTVVTYKCNPGFIPSGPIESTCLDNNGIPGWTPLVHMCKSCDDPPHVNNALVDTMGNNLVNSVRIYQCLPGYHPSGPIEAICMGDKGATFWHLTEHICKSCDRPPKIPNAVLVKPGDTLVNSVRVYKCLKGFQPTGPIETMCIGANGVTYWDGPEHRCVACIPPPQLDNAILDPLGDTLVGSVRSYSCMEGFVPTGPIEVGCISGTGGPLWTNNEFQCVACSEPTALPNAVLDVSGTNLVGHQRRYHCVDGFVPTQPGPIITECIGEYIDNRGRAYWGPPSHGCTACPDPPLMDNAAVDPGNNLVGTHRHYKCVGGYHATGPMVTQCLDTATWSPLDHSCTACGHTPDIHNADIIPGPHTLGTVRKFKCHHGLVPNSAPVIECLPDAQWSPVLFECVGCEPPKKIPFAVLEPGDNLVGTVRRFTCIPGFLETGPITSTCATHPDAILPDWSKPVHFCKDCGDPYPVEFADIIDGPRTLGSVQKYVCHKGFVPSGPPHSHCMKNAEWTPPAFKCIKCGKPPKIEHAIVDTNGTSHVGSVRAYSCMNGFVATGPIEKQCDFNTTAEGNITYWRSLTDHYCKDCGIPPKFDNAYANLGPTTIGALQKYSCMDGYEMIGTNTIECLPAGNWSSTNFICNVMTTTTTTTPAPVKNDPSICDGCRMLNGVGYIRHPFDCSQYVQCFYSARGGIEATYMPCSFGQYWDQEDLTCKPADEVDCPTEKCMNPELTSYRDDDSSKCCAYWECQNGKSVAKCCGEGYRYVQGKGCELDPECDDECPWDDMLPACDKRPMMDVSRYEQHIGNGYWISMMCAPGTAFDIIDCECSLRTHVLPGYVCRPELYMDFNDGFIKDVSGRNVYVLNDGVKAHNGSAYFNGRSRLLINRFSNTAFHGDLVIKFRYNEQLKGPTASALQALVTNGDCGDDPSIIIAKMPGYVLCGAKTKMSKSIALPTMKKEWKEVIYIHDEEKLEAKVCGASYNEWSLGPIQSTHCAIQIGHGTGLANFMGLMDDISLYQCRPPQDVLSVYGRRTFDEGSPATMNIHK